MDDIGETLHHLLLDPLIGRVILAFVALLLLQLVLKAMRRQMEKRFHGTEFHHHLERIIRIFAWAASIAVVVGIFSKYLGHATVALGVVGAGVAFALQEVITSIAGWVAISFGGFFGVMDRVQLGGITGDVIDIGFLRTTVMETGQWVKGDQYNGRIVRIANSFIFKEPVYNYSADFPFVWDEIVLPVHTGCDATYARELLLRVAQEVVGEYVPDAETHWKQMRLKYTLDGATLEPMVLMAVTDNWLEFVLRYVVRTRYAGWSGTASSPACSPRSKIAKGN